MEIIYTNAYGTETGYLTQRSADFLIAEENDCDLHTNNPNNLFSDGCMLHIEYFALGGIVNSITLDTTIDTSSYGGYTWRGMLANKIVEPDTNADYYTISGTFYNVVSTLIAKCNIGALFVADSIVTENMASYQCKRYDNLLNGLLEILDKVGYTLKLTYKNSKVVVSAEIQKDYSDTYEISTDNKIKYKMTTRTDFVNQWICLGQGELKNRQVIHLYANSNGVISTTKSITGINEIVETYDYSSVESLEELNSGGIAEFKKRREQSKVSVNVDDSLDLNIGDLISCYDLTTNTEIKREISQKIITISALKVVKISYKVGDL